MAATSDMGIVLKREFPYAHVVSQPCLTTVCSYCLRKIGIGEKLKRCAGCKVLYYCDSDCQKRDYADHKVECSYLSKISHSHAMFMSDSLRLMSRVLMKRKRDNKPAFNGRTLESLMSHSDEILNSPARKAEFLLTKAGLSLQFGSENLPPDADLLELFGKLKINAFGIMNMKTLLIGSGLYIGFSELDHACDSDVCGDFAGAEMLIRPIKKGITTYHGELRISYCHPLQCGPARRKFLNESFYFTCNCARCNDADWDAMARSLRCQFCCNGYCPLYLDGDKVKSKPVCTVCGLVSEADLDAAVSLMSELERKRDEVETALSYGAGGAEDPKLLLSAATKLFEKGEKSLSCFNISLYRFARELKGAAEVNGALEFCSDLEEKVMICFRHFLPESDPCILTECLAAGIAHVRARKMKLAKQRLEQALKFSLEAYGRGDPLTRLAQLEHCIAFKRDKKWLKELMRSNMK